MSQNCYYKRLNFGSSTIQGTITFSKFVDTTFYLNGNQIGSPNVITLNNNVFNNGTNPSNSGSGITPPLSNTYLGFEIPFTITLVPNEYETALSVTGAIINQRIPCQPEVSCQYSINDPLGEVAEGTLSVSIPKQYSISNARLYFSVNGSYEDQIGVPYTIRYQGLRFQNGWNSAPGKNNSFHLDSSGISINQLYINNFLCKTIFTPFSQNEYSNNHLLTEAWFWDIFTGLFFVLFWYWFYNYKMLIRVKLKK